jgi:hypothetical protein
MLHVPNFKKINTSNELDIFATNYTACSGFVVNRDYYTSNQVFGIWWKGAMVGGFVLGTGAQLRTLEVFASDANRPALYDHVRASVAHTEMCCFWMAASIRKKTWLNLLVWIYVAYALQYFGTKQLIFGTNSARLAALYSAAEHSRLLHSDVVKHKHTFIFTGPRSCCVLGVVQIMVYKIRRLWRLSRGRGGGVGLCPTLDIAPLQGLV